jgi:four helix bundle protein
VEGLNRLELYLAAQDLAKFVYCNVLNQLPIEEKWGLVSQIRRAAASIPANIAEGYGRFYYQETIRFCYIARGSLMEMSSYIELALDQGYLSKEMTSIITEKSNLILKLIHGYIKYLKQNKRGWNEPGASAISEPDSTYYSNDDENEIAQ